MKYKYWLVALLMVGLSVAAFARPQKKKTGLMTIDMASPVLFRLGPDGKPLLIMPKDIIFQLRSDGVVSWKVVPVITLPPQAPETKEEGLPAPGYESGNR